MQLARMPSDAAAASATSSTSSLRDAHNFDGVKCQTHKTRSSADADNRLDAFSGQSRSTRSLRVLSFDRLCMVSY